MQKTKIVQILQTNRKRLSISLPKDASFLTIQLIHQSARLLPATILRSFFGLFEASGTYVLP